jgi:hypothetical protein
MGLGVAAGALAATMIYGLAFVEQRLGYVRSLPWPIANGEPVNVAIAVGGGFRNLVGEEVFVRLGVQSIASYCLRGLRAGPTLSVFLSALCFEFWHSPFQVPLFLNFTVSLILGWTYNKYGYESAAVGHCVTDWLILGIFPPLFFNTT